MARPCQFQKRELPIDVNHPQPVPEFASSTARQMLSSEQGTERRNFFTDFTDAVLYDYPVKFIRGTTVRQSEFGRGEESQNWEMTGTTTSMHV